MSRQRWLAATALLAVLAFWPAADAAAQSGSGKGHVSYMLHGSEEVQLPDGGMGLRVHWKGIVMAHDPNVPFHMSTQDCVGFVHGEPTTGEGRGYCDGVDRDGDVWWIWWKNLPEGRTWGFMGGTGKFKGIEGGGTTTQGPLWPDNRNIIMWEGKWTVK